MCPHQVLSCVPLYSSGIANQEGKTGKDISQGGQDPQKVVSSDDFVPRKIPILDFTQSWDGQDNLLGGAIAPLAPA